jgi:anti-repressor protein
MNNLDLATIIPVSIESGIQTINARNLWQWLESKQDFSTWIKSRIDQYDFEENVDYVRFHKKMEANNASMIDYHLSLDMAKELAMVERNEQGKAARKYFIACEKKALEQTQDLSPVEMLLQQCQMMVAQEKRTKAIEQEQRQQADRLKQLEAKIDPFNGYMSVVGYVNIHKLRIPKNEKIDQNSR